MATVKPPSAGLDFEQSFSKASDSLASRRGSVARSGMLAGVSGREPPIRLTPVAMSTATLEPVQRLIADEMRAVDDVIRRRLHSEVLLVRQVSEHIIGSGGGAQWYAWRSRWP